AASSNVTVSDNTVADNGAAGVAVLSSNASVTGNTIYGNSTGGVLVAGSDSDTISGNTIGDGISLYGATNTVIQGNYVGVDSSGTSLNNFNDGIFADSNSSSITVTDNTIGDNGGAGVNLEAADSSVTGNTISNDTFGGVVVSGADSDTI